MEPSTVLLPAHGTCQSVLPVDLSEDVGLETGVCPACKSYFVFIKSSNTWQKEDEFEQNLQSKAGDVSKLLS